MATALRVAALLVAVVAVVDVVRPVTFIEAHCNMFVFPKSFKLSSLRLHHKVTLIIVEHKERHMQSL